MSEVHSLAEQNDTGPLLNGMERCSHSYTIMQKETLLSYVTLSLTEVIIFKTHTSAFHTGHKNDQQCHRRLKIPLREN